MYSPPFHRRILPLIFAVTFVAAAPAVVFYTAGYRWNPKKEKVERNGTLILNSRPTGAKITLNGNDIGETTPSTIQNVAPGKTVIRYEKDGYHPWQKALDVLPEYVTFANEVWLWKTGEPTATPVGSAVRLQTSPNEKIVGALTVTDATTSVILWSPSNNATATYPLGHLDAQAATLSWSEDSHALLVEERAATGTRRWLVNARATHEPISLPTGSYRWNGSRLEGSADGYLFEINVDTEAISRSPLLPGVVDQAAGMVLRHATGTNALVLFQDGNRKRGLILPPGDWRIDRVVNNHVILRDGPSWISLDPDESDPHPTRVSGDFLRTFTERGQTTFLLVKGGEVWLWNPASDPELLLRESAAIGDVAWHSSGRNIVLAMDGTVTMLNLDPRDGRLRTSLALFDEVTDVAFVKKTLYVAARKGNHTGMWELGIE